jgi:hypothetical protein
MAYNKEVVLGTYLELMAERLDWRTAEAVGDVDQSHFQSVEYANML